MLLQKHLANSTFINIRCVHLCCGYWGDTQRACTCAPAVVTKYQKRISGLLLDRIDIYIEFLVWTMKD